MINVPSWACFSWSQEEEEETIRPSKYTEKKDATAEIQKYKEENNAMNMNRPEKE